MLDLAPHSSFVAYTKQYNEKKMGNGMETRGLLGLDISQLDLGKCGVTWPPTTDVIREINQIASVIQQGNLQKLINQYNGKIDRLAFYAYQACVNGSISLNQLVTLLEVRSILQLNPSHFSIEKINDKNIRDSKSVIRQYVANLYQDFIVQTDIKNRLIDELDKENRGEAYTIVFSVAISELPPDNRFIGFLNLGKQIKALDFKSDTDISKSYTFTWLSVTAREALSKIVYKEQAKKSKFHHGADISREIIESGMTKRERYMAVFLPGTLDATSFHEINAAMFFLIAHDEFHRQMISAIPDGIYDALLYLAEKFREVSNRQWSTEIWRLFDMEFSLDNLTIAKKSKDRSYTEQFIKLVSGNDASDMPLNIMLPTPYCDTTWLILILMVQDKIQWNSWAIVGSELPKPYNDMYRFITKNLKKLSDELSFPQKLLALKCNYLHIMFPKEAEVSFSKRAKGRPTYIDITVNKEPHIYSKDSLVDIYTDLNPTDSIVKDINKLLTVIINYDDVLKSFFLRHLRHKSIVTLLALSVDNVDHSPGYLMDVLAHILELKKRIDELKIDFNMLQSSLRNIESFAKAPLLAFEYIDKMDDETLKRVAFDPMFLSKFIKAAKLMSLAPDDLNALSTAGMIGISQFYPLSSTDKPLFERYAEKIMNAPENDKLYFMLNWKRCPFFCKSEKDIDFIFSLGIAEQDSLFKNQEVLIGKSKLNLDLDLSELYDRYIKDIKIGENLNNVKTNSKVGLFANLDQQATTTQPHLSEESDTKGSKPVGS